MATQTSKPSRPVSSPTTPTGEESVTPISQPSGLGALSASTTIESDRKSEVIQRAQIGSFMGANRNNEPQNKTPKTWRVKCISTSEASEILVGCKRIEKESLRQAHWELQQWFSALQVDSTLSATAQPFQPWVAPQSS